MNTHWIVISALLLSTFLNACETEPTVKSRAVTVQSPIPGRVIIGGVEGFVTPESAALLQGDFGSRFDLTFVSDEERITLLSLTGDTVDLSSFVGQPEPVRGMLMPLIMRLEPPDSGNVVVIAGEQIFTPEAETSSDTLTFALPRGVEATAIALWQGESGIEWTVKPMGTPEVLQGTETVLRPDVMPAFEIALHLMNTPIGWASGELVYRGVRTGLLVGEGVVSPRQAMTLATTGVENEDLTLWVSVTSGTVSSDQPRSTMGVSIPLDRGSVGLNWPGEPRIDPLPRGEQNAVPISRDEGVWQIQEETLGATWLDVQLTGLGVCRKLNWRVIGPPSKVFELPVLDSANVFEAPLLHGTVSAVWKQDSTWNDVVTRPTRPHLLPRSTAQRTLQSVSGFWRTETSCEQHPDFGRYAVNRADESACQVDGVADVYLLDRCGSLVRIFEGHDAQPEHCGSMIDTGFKSLAGQTIQVEQVEGGGSRVGPGVTGFFLTPIPESNLSVDERLAGEWTRFEIWEQDFLLLGDGFEQAQNDPVLISIGRGESGPWLRVNADGRARSNAHLANFDLTLREVDGARAFVVDAPGCRAQPRVLEILPDPEFLVLRERLPRERADEIRIRTYTYRR